MVTAPKSARMISVNKKKTVVVIVGPTAVGKTSLAIKLARKIRGEIISCDSMQVYRGMNVLSQAIPPSERNEVRHHLIGILSPREEYSAAAFRKKAVQLIDSIIARGKVPIFAGGSGLYVKALVDGLFLSPASDIAFRKKMEKFASRYGKARLYNRLKKIDPEAAGKIHPNDKRRIIRALEIYNSTGRTMSEMKSETIGLGGDYDIRIFGLTRPRDALYSAINSRAERIFAGGAVKEVKRLSHVRMSKTAKAVLGFKEILGYLKGEYSPEAAVELMKRNTRRFAKRQLTWFRADGRIEWFDADRLNREEIIGAIIERLNGWNERFQ